MAFRPLLLLLSVLLLITADSTAAISIREKCECMMETRSVQWRKMKDYTVIPKHPLCNKVQLIIQLPGQKACLDPESKQGKKLLRCWKRIKFNLPQRRLCLRLRRKRPKSGKKP